MQILLIDQGRLLLYDGERFEPASPKAAKSRFCAASLPMGDIITHTLRLPATLSEEQLRIEVELKMYEEAQLDPNKEYRIDFVRMPVENELLIEAFAYAKDRFDERFGELSKKIAAIDLLFPSFLSFEVLQQKSDGNEIFIHLGKEEAYALFYKQGEYIGHRLLDSLETIAKKSGIELAKLTELLQSKGLKRENYELDEVHLLDTLEPIFVQNIEKIVYSINQKRSLFLYDHVDRIVIDFEGEWIEGVEQIFGAFGIEGVEFLPFDYRQKRKEAYLYLQADYALAIAQSQKLQSANLTFLERKPPLWRYRSIQWIAAAAVCALLMAGGYFYAQRFVQEQRKEIATLERKLSKYKKILKRYNQKLKDLQKRKSALLKQKEQEEGVVRTIEVTLEAMPLIVANKIERERFMNDILASLAKYRLQSEAIAQHGTKWMEVLLVSRSDRREDIAKFLNRMLELGYSKAGTQKIWQENGLYKSLVKVER